MVTMRPSQFVLVYGPGAILETKDGPRMIPDAEEGLFLRRNLDGVDLRIVDERMSSGLLEGAEIFRLPSKSGGSCLAPVPDKTVSSLEAVHGFVARRQVCPARGCGWQMSRLRQSQGRGDQIRIGVLRRALGRGRLELRGAPGYKMQRHLRRRIQIFWPGQVLPLDRRRNGLLHSAAMSKVPRRVKLRRGILCRV